MPPFKDITGVKYGRLLPVWCLGRKSKEVWFRCACDCGRLHDAASNSIRRGKTRSCGCLNIEAATKHGMSRTKFYSAFQSMHQRVNPNTKNPVHRRVYDGLTVDERWDTFENFMEDMYEAYLAHQKEFGEKNTSLDRIDNLKGYSKENCRWATTKIQRDNQRPGIRLRLSCTRGHLFKDHAKTQKNGSRICGICSTEYKRNWYEQKQKI